jgi:hypothetical protein
VIDPAKDPEQRRDILDNNTAPFLRLEPTGRMQP